TATMRFIALRELRFKLRATSYTNVGLEIDRMSVESGDASAGAAAPPDIVVAIGASAGGVAALKQFFTYVPRDTAAAFVVVLHLSPDHESHLAQVLQTSSALPVVRLADRTRLAGGRVYVISPDSSLTVNDGDVVAAPVMTAEQRHAPV